MKTMSVFRTSGVALNPISCGENWISSWQQMHDKTDPAMILIKSAKYNRGGLSRNLGNSLSHPLFGNKPRKQGADHLPSTQYSFEILEPEAFNKLNHQRGFTYSSRAHDNHFRKISNQHLLMIRLQQTKLHGQYVIKFDVVATLIQ